jgi:hypothetical protein
MSYALLRETLRTGPATEATIDFACTAATSASALPLHGILVTKHLLADEVELGAGLPPAGPAHVPPGGSVVFELCISKQAVFRYRSLFERTDGRSPAKTVVHLAHAGRGRGHRAVAAGSSTSAAATGLDARNPAEFPSQLLESLCRYIHVLAFLDASSSSGAGTVFSRPVRLRPDVRQTATGCSVSIPVPADAPIGSAVCIASAFLAGEPVSALSPTQIPVVESAVSLCAPCVDTVARLRVPLSHSPPVYSAANCPQSAAVTSDGRVFVACGRNILGFRVSDGSLLPPISHESARLQDRIYAAAYDPASHSLLLGDYNFIDSQASCIDPGKITEQQLFSPNSWNLVFRISVAGRRTQ